MACNLPANVKDDGRGGYNEGEDIYGRGWGWNSKKRPENDDENV